MKTQPHTLFHAAPKTQPRWIVLAAFSLVAALPVWSQIDRGTIQGQVKDSSGGVVPDAKVQIVRIDTNSTIDLKTNGEGLYIAPNLPAANYRLVVEKAGFSKVTREPVEVQPRAQATVDFTLQPGTVNESVTVTTEAPILDTAAVNNSVGFKDKLVQELPLIVVGTKRDITGFLDNMPGANNTNTFIPTVNGSAVKPDGRVHRRRSRERAASRGARCPRMVRSSSRWAR